MDGFIRAVALYASLMGVDAPPVQDVDNLPGLQGARAVFDGYGWRIERDKGSPAYLTWSKDSLALHEMCHVKTHSFEHSRVHTQCELSYWKKRREHAFSKR